MLALTNFWQALFDAPYLFIAIIAAIGCLYFTIFKSYNYSLFDPMLIWLLFTSFGTADVFFMYSVGMVSLYHLTSFCLTQGFFIAGFLVFRPIKKVYPCKLYKQSSGDDRMIGILAALSGLIYVACQLTTYMALGVSLLKESRLMTFAEGGGLGVLGRVTMITSQIFVFTLLYRYSGGTKKTMPVMLYDAIVLLFVLVSGILSGSKSTFLVIIYIMFYFSLFFQRSELLQDYLTRIRKYQYRLFCFAFVAAMSIISFELTRAFEGGETTSPLFQLLVRFLQSGDVFMFAYPDNVLDLMAYDNPFKVIFADLLGLTRVFSWDELPIALGNQLYRFHYDSDLPMGPNPLHNVFGLFYFGYLGSLIYSFCVGMIFSFIRNRLLFTVSSTPTGGLLYVLLSINLFAIVTDISLSMYYLDNLLLVAPVLIIISCIVSRIDSGGMMWPLLKQASLPNTSQIE